MNKLRHLLAAPLLALGLLFGSAAVQPAAAMPVLQAEEQTSEDDVTIIIIVDEDGEIIGVIIIRSARAAA